VAIEQQLSDVLSEFARTMLTDFPIQAILDRLVERIVEVLPITAAGVTLITPTRLPRYVAASDPSALRFETLQTELGEGPCLEAYSTGGAVAVADLRAEHRFGTFTEQALEAGLAAVFTFPLRSGSGDQLGALDLYRDTPGPLDADAMAAAQTLADVAAAYLLNAQARAELADASERSRVSALHDPLTGLPNRVLLMELIDHVLLRAARSKKIAAVLFADLDRFKSVNDRYGHRLGDELLVAVASRLSSLLRPGDTLGRLSGDEFVIICEGLDDRSQALVIANRIGLALSTPFELSSAYLEMTASVGIAVAELGEVDSERLLQDADVAMYQAKAKGGAQHQSIDQRQQRESIRRTNLGHDLQRALADNEMRVEYQPIVQTGDGQVTGFEALVRWRHPTLGDISPTRLIPIAEESGLIKDIGRWVLEQSCTDLHRWMTYDRRTELGMSVNVSAHQLMVPGFAAAVQVVLDETRTVPARLTLELTESVLIDDAARALVVLSDLKRIGVRIALDDFGTGYSSLNYLEQFPVDVIKVDQSFVAKLERSAPSRAIVASIVNLAHALGEAVVAEGVESSEQREQVLLLGCESSQGFFFARPMSVAMIAKLIEGQGGLEVQLPLPVPALVV